MWRTTLYQKGFFSHVIKTLWARWSSVISPVFQRYQHCSNASSSVFQRHQLGVPTLSTLCSNASSTVFQRQQHCFNAISSVFQRHPHGVLATLLLLTGGRPWMLSLLAYDSVRRVTGVFKNSAAKMSKMRPEFSPYVYPTCVSVCLFYDKGTTQG